MDEWKRFANAAVQEELIAKTEALRVKFGFDMQASTPPAPAPAPDAAVNAESGDATVPTVEGEAPASADAVAAQGPKPEDLEKLARELHEIQERWKTVAEAPRAQAQALWHRYRQAADPMQTRVREFFAVRNEQRRAISNARSRSSRKPRRSPSRPTGSRPPTR